MDKLVIPVLIDETIGSIRIIKNRIWKNTRKNRAEILEEKCQK